MHDGARAGSSYWNNEPLLLVRDQLSFLVANQVDIPGHLGLNGGDVQANGERQGNGSLAEAHVAAAPDGDKLEKASSEQCFVQLKLVAGDQLEHQHGVLFHSSGL